MSEEVDNLSHILPTDFLEKMIGTKVTVLNGANLEITGILRGFDSYVNLVMEDVTSVETTSDGTFTTKSAKIILTYFRIVAFIPHEVSID